MAVRTVREAGLLAIAAVFELAILEGVYAGFGRALPLDLNALCRVAFVISTWAWPR